MSTPNYIKIALYISSCGNSVSTLHLLNYRGLTAKLLISSLFFFQK